MKDIDGTALGLGDDVEVMGNWSGSLVGSGEEASKAYFDMGLPRYFSIDRLLEMPQGCEFCGQRHLAILPPRFGFHGLCGCGVRKIKPLDDQVSLEEVKQKTLSVAAERLLREMEDDIREDRERGHE